MNPGAKPLEIARHYAVAGLEDTLRTGLAAAGLALDDLEVDDLAPVDGFHLRGRAATEELAELTTLSARDRVLDVGCGIGGTARFLASRTGCTVIGLDLTDEFCRVGEWLTGLVGLSGRVQFRCGDARAIPCSPGSFDVVWTEHAQMNIADKPLFYGEVARVLRPGGLLAFHDILAGPSSDLALPVPWASESHASHLVAPESLRELLEDAGFELVAWDDDTERSLTFLHEVLAAVRANGPAPLGLHLLMGPSAREKLANVARNLEADRLRVVRGVARWRSGLEPKRQGPRS